MHKTISPSFWSKHGWCSQRIEICLACKKIEFLKYLNTTSLYWKLNLPINSPGNDIFHWVQIQISAEPHEWVNIIQCLAAKHGDGSDHWNNRQYQQKEGGGGFINGYESFYLISLQTKRYPPQPLNQSAKSSNPRCSQINELPLKILKLHRWTIGLAAELGGANWGVFQRFLEIQDLNNQCRPFGLDVERCKESWFPSQTCFLRPHKM